MKELGQNFGHQESLKLFTTFRQQHPNTKSPELFGEALSAYSELGQQSEVESLFEQVKINHIDVKHLPASSIAAVLEMYARLDQPDKAINFVEELTGHGVELSVDSYSLINSFLERTIKNQKRASRGATDDIFKE